MSDKPAGTSGPPEQEGFLSRWSRRKAEGARADRPSSDRPSVATEQPGLEHGQGIQDAEDAAGDASGSQVARVDDGATDSPTRDEARTTDAHAHAVDDFADVDFDALDFSSDYTRFMKQGVPDEIRNRALAKLWRSDPILANLDGLVEYADDYTDAAVAFAPGALKTAYKVGQGFLSDEEARSWDSLGAESRNRAAGGAPDAATGLDREDDSAGHVAGISAGAGPDQDGPPPSVTFGFESPAQADAHRLFAASNAYSASLYPAESNHPVTPEALVATAARFLVVRDAEGRAVGCGALRIDADRTAELKRMCVEPGARGTGLGRRLLERLVAEARERQVKVIRLETGIRQPAAIALYRSAGFVDCPPFGSYGPDPLSLFLELDLEAGKSITLGDA